jgi:hypothetical protein
MNLEHVTAFTAAMQRKDLEPCSLTWPAMSSSTHR